MKRPTPRQAQSGCAREPKLTRQSCDYLIAMLLFAVALLLAGAMSSPAAPACSYTRTINSGYTPLANQCANTSLIPDLINDANATAPIPDQSVVLKYDNASQSWEACNVYSASTKTWLFPNQTLLPGEGAIVYNPGASYTLTISGGNNTDTACGYCTSVGLFLVSNKTPVACATYPAITGCPDPNHPDNDGEGPPPDTYTTVYKWNGSVFAEDDFDQFGTFWTIVPSTAIGEPLFICPWGYGSSYPPCSPPVVPCCVQIAATVTLTWPCNCKLQQGPTINGPWSTVLDGNNQPVTSPYTTTPSGSTGYFRTSCP